MSKKNHKHPAAYCGPVKKPTKHERKTLRILKSDIGPPQEVFRAESGACPAYGDHDRVVVRHAFVGDK